MARRDREPRTECVELIVQALLKHLARIDELRAVADDAEHRRDAGRLGRTTGALAQQPDQRGAVAVVGLEPPCTGLSDEVCVVLVTDSALVAGKGRHDYQLHL